MMGKASCSDQPMASYKGKAKLQNTLSNLTMSDLSITFKSFMLFARTARTHKRHDF